MEEKFKKIENTLGAIHCFKNKYKLLKFRMYTHSNTALILSYLWIWHLRCVTLHLISSHWPNWPTTVWNLFSATSQYIISVPFFNTTYLSLPTGSMTSKKTASQPGYFRPGCEEPKNKFRVMDHSHFSDTMQCPLFYVSIRLVCLMLWAVKRQQLRLCHTFHSFEYTRVTQRKHVWMRGGALL